MSVFIDTNICVYALVAEAHEARKRTLALDILKRDDGILSQQVLAETYRQVTRQGRTNALSHAEAETFLRSLERFPIVANTSELFFKGLAIRRSTNYSIWDCLIIAAALQAGCDTILSEDMRAGHVIGSLSIVNPFT